jgi:hypothetical protein
MRSRIITSTPPAHDALHRRVIDYKYVDYGQSQPADPEIARIDLYYSDRWQVIEDASEHSGLNSATTIATTNVHVWSPGYVDDLVLPDRKVVVSVADEIGEVGERALLRAVPQRSSHLHQHLHLHRGAERQGVDAYRGAGVAALFA